MDCPEKGCARLSTPHILVYINDNSSTVNANASVTK